MRLPHQKSSSVAVGLDIEPGSVTAAVTDGSGQAVIRAASAPLAPGVVREGEVADADALAAALRELFERHRLDRNVRLGVANQRIVMRTLDLPPVEKAKEITSVVQFQAQEQIPMPLEEAVLQHRSLGLVETQDGQRTRVMLVAARRDMLEGMLAAVRQAGLRPVGIDLSAFAMIRALHDPTRPGGALYISVGGITNLALANGATCLFTRSIPYGMDTMAGELAERCSIDGAEAHALLRRGGLTEPLDAHGADHQLVLDARSVLMSGIARVADEVRNTLAFHSMQQPALVVERAVVTGAAAGIDGFCDGLGAEIGLPTDLGVVREAALCAFGGVEPTSLTVAAGLTVDEVPA